MKICAAPSNKDENEVEKDRDVKKRPPANLEDLKPRAPVVTVSNFSSQKLIDRLI